MALGNKKKIVIRITDSAINVLIGNKVKIDASETILLREGVCEDGKIKDKETIINTLNNYLDVNASKVDDVSFVLRGSDIITRYIEVPIMKDNALREAIYFEFNQFIPEVDSYYMDYEIVEKINTKEKKAYKILLVAVTKEKVDPLVEIAEGIDRDLDVIDILSNSMARLLKSGNYIDDGFSTGVFYLGTNSSTLSIIEDKILKIERTLPFGVKNIFKQINSEAAATVMDSNEVMSIVENERLQMSFEALLSSINNTIRYYNSDRKNNPINKFIIICGDMIIDGIAEYWQKYFDLPSVLVTDPADLDLRVRVNKNFDKNVANYGILLRNSKLKMLNLNPSSIDKTRNRADLDKTLTRLVAIVVVGLGIIAVPLPVVNAIITKEIATVEANIGEYASVIAVNGELKTENNRMQNFINKIHGIKENTIETSNIIEKINTHIPKDITFMNFSFNESGTISISGESKSYDAIPEFLANLEMSDEFNSCSISYINPIEKTVVIGTKKVPKQSSTSSIETTSTVSRNSEIALMNTTNKSSDNTGIMKLDASGDSSSSNANNSGSSQSGTNNSASTTSGSQSTNGDDGYETVEITETVKVYSFSISIEEVKTNGEAAETE